MERLAHKNVLSHEPAGHGPDLKRFDAEALKMLNSSFVCLTLEFSVRIFFVCNIHVIFNTEIVQFGDLDLLELVMDPKPGNFPTS